MGLTQKNFFKGDYAAVLEGTTEKTTHSPEDFPYIIGSLSFLGRLTEAEAHYRAFKNRANPRHLSYAYFFLSIGRTRRSDYAKARAYLMQNKRLLASGKNDTDSEINFLVEQGISFFYFFLGNFESSLKWNEKSLSSAMAAKNHWMQALAQDLMANNLIQNGRIHEGLLHFREAEKAAAKIENKALTTALQISTAVLRCEFGIETAKSFDRLKKLFFEAAQNDSFSRSNLGLEMARQYTLRGDFKAAAEVLNQISSLIFQSQNRRQEARYNLRWAELYFMKNEANTSLHYIRSGQRCLEHVDYTFEMQFLGMEIKVYEQLLQTPARHELLARLESLSTKFRNVKNDNISLRNSHLKPFVTPDNDDEIHKLLLQANENKNSARKIILETGYFSWLYRFFDLKRGQKYILLNLEPKSITLVCNDGIFHKPQELSTLHHRILSTLATGYTGKEALVNKVWGYQYDPLRHDSLIYSTFSSLRKLLAEDPHIIETSEIGYNLTAQVLNLLDTKATNKTAEKLETPVLTGDSTTWLKHDLNSRQIQIMELLQTERFLSVRNLIKIFNISEITANRDLRSLYDKKLVLRVGRGRGTQYTARR